MCFSPQWRAIFRHLNFQKWSKHAVFCTFWLANVLFATAACNFWFLLWAPTSAPAALTGLLFDWPDTRIIEKTQHFATSLTFGADVSSFFWLSRYCIFCRLTWWLYCWAMHLLFNCPYCRKFLFKLPSIKCILSLNLQPSLTVWPFTNSSTIPSDVDHLGPSLHRNLSTVGLHGRATVGQARSTDLSMDGWKLRMSPLDWWDLIGWFYCYFWYPIWWC